MFSFPKFPAESHAEVVFEKSRLARGILGFLSSDPGVEANPILPGDDDRDRSLLGRG